MTENPGYCPDDAKGKRVIVRLKNGLRTGFPNGWAADGRGGCVWAKSDSQWSIVEYEVIQ